MHTCRICLKAFKKANYSYSRGYVCGRCTRDLNNYHQTADNAYESARQLLLNGMYRRSISDIQLTGVSSWRAQRAKHVLDNLEHEVNLALPKWINKLVADKSNTTKIFKMIRAHRRGLLHLDRPHNWGYPKNWCEVAHNIRNLDKYTCVACSKTRVELHVHHIVYLSNYGTHQKTNLVTLCRQCHENEHSRSFDFCENTDISDEPRIASDLFDAGKFTDEIEFTILLVRQGDTDFFNDPAQKTSDKRDQDQRG
jgi:5-methylcytosine-specific restriction endonuclease McrA